MDMSIQTYISNLFRATLGPNIASQYIGCRRCTSCSAEISVPPAFTCHQRKLMHMTVFADKGDLFTAAFWPLEANHQIDSSWSLGERTQIDMLPGLALWHEQFMDLPILPYICYLFTAPFIPAITDHVMTSWKRGVGDSCQVYMLPPCAFFYP